MTLDLVDRIKEDLKPFTSDLHRAEGRVSFEKALVSRLRQTPASQLGSHARQLVRAWGAQVMKEALLDTRPPRTPDHDDPEIGIRWLAQRCATRDLRRKHALYLFDTLWVADLVFLHHGNVSAACEASGMSRGQFYRLVRRGHPGYGEEEEEKEEL